MLVILILFMKPLFSMSLNSLEFVRLEHEHCLANNTSICQDNTEFYYLDSGCGCFENRTILPSAVCMTFPIHYFCADDEKFSAVYQLDKRSGIKEFKGCGCFLGTDNL
jgi:hypothetical protein